MLASAPQLRRLLEHVSSLLGQPHRQTTAIVRIGRPFDQAGPDQDIDRAADGWSAATRRLRDLVQSRRLVRPDGSEQSTAGAICPFGRTVRQIILSDGDKTRGDGSW